MSNQNIEELRQRVHRDQANCTHDWGTAVYAPYIVKEGCGYGLIPELSHGSDPYFGFTSYQEVAKPRWKRECKKCGKVEETEKRGQKTVDTGPEF